MDYALRQEKIPTQSSVAKSCEELGVNPADIVKDISFIIPELKGVLKPKDLMDIDFSGCTFEQRGDKGWIKKIEGPQPIGNIYKLVSILDSAGCIVSIRKPVLSPKFHDFNEDLEFETTGDFPAKWKIHIPERVKKELIQRSGEQIDWQKVSPEDLIKVHIGPNYSAPHNSLRRLLEHMGREDIWEDIIEIQLNSYEGDQIRLAGELL